MSKVFLGGSRSLSWLDSAARARLRSLIAHGHTVLVGDANGIDKAIQSFFAEEDYRDVIVYCMEAQCRNNVGNWPIESVSSGGRAKDFAYFAVKDARMGLEADYGFMIWDGASKGTLNNVLSLLEQGKAVLVYRSTTGSSCRSDRSRRSSRSWIPAPPTSSSTSIRRSTWRNGYERRRSPRLDSEVTA